MLVATVLALVAAVLHAGWNLAAKSASDRFGALWAQFLVGGVISAGALAIVGLPPGRALPWALLSGITHVPYTLFLARAYERGDFSLSYPVARGGGALLAAVGGIVLLDDDLRPGAVVAIAVVGLGLVALRGRTSGPGLRDALVVAVMIGTYTTIDAHGARVAGTDSYALVGFVILGILVSVAGIGLGRTPRLVATVRQRPGLVVLAGLATVVTYSIVLMAVRRAPVGYVAALRESSVVLAAWIGWRHLDEPAGRGRVAASAVIVGGLVLLVVSR